jgi:Ribbon-helix-helix protein, copG family
MVDDEDDIYTVKRGRPVGSVGDSEKLLKATLNVAVTEKDKRTLEELAEGSGTTLPKFVRRVLKDYIKQADEGLSR